MSWLHGMYGRLPLRAQRLATASVGYLTARHRYGRQYRRCLHEFVAMDRADAEALWHYSRVARERTLELASRTPYYGDLFKSMGAEWFDLVDDEAFRQIPITRRSDVQGREHLFRPRRRHPGDRQARTSGTTGSPLSLLQSRLAQSAQWAIWWRYRGWHGLTRKTPLAVFGGKPIVAPDSDGPYWRPNPANREVRFSVYHIGPRTVGAYVAELNRIRAPWIHGYPSALASLSHLAISEGLTLDQPPRVVTTGAEGLSGHQKSLIESFFGAPARQHYGQIEGVANVSECPEGALHVDEEFGGFELLPTGMSNHEAEILGTTFWNDATVLIRYGTGDTAVLGNAACGCGRRSRVLESIDGRMEDAIVLPDGRQVGRLSPVITAVGGIAEAQFYQHADGSVELLYVPVSGDDESIEGRLRKSLQRRLGCELPVKLVRTSQIPRTSRGKLRLVVSELGRHRA